MKNQIKFFTLLFFASLLAFSSCKKDDEPEFIDPADSNALTTAIIIPDADTNNGDLPNSSSDPQAPIIATNLADILSSNGGTVPLTFTYSNVSGRLAGSHLQIVGATNYYFSVPFSGESGESGTLTIPATLPTNLLEGEFCVNFWVYDEEGRVSNVVSTCVNVIVLGSGSLQISLSWNTATDQDLHVIDPNNDEIAWDNRNSPSGGELDRDDQDGYGPENIYWLENAPDGTFKVTVHDYTGNSTPNNFFVTVNAPGRTKTFTGETQNGNTVDVVTIEKSGNNYDF
jgi:hypothetical protein